jgi:hypothetical protein
VVWSDVWRLWTLLPGVIVVAGALREVFEDLFHPTATGTLSDLISRGVFSVFRKSRRLLPIAGPLALVLVIFSWAILLTVGFALLYYSSLPADFRAQSGTPDHGFWTALYFSFEVMTTLGLGELTPNPAWLRMLVSFHALVGFALVTASVSWIVLLYPALARMRSLARRASLLAEAQERTGVSIVSASADGILGDFATELIRTRVDLVYFPIIYYFHADSERASLPHSLPLLARFADEGSKRWDSESVRLSAAALRVALDDLAKLLAERFVDADPKDVEGTFRAYAEQHVSGGTKS